MKKILITGVNGFIGGCLATECLRKKIDVIGVDRDSVAVAEGIIYYQLNLYSDFLDELLCKYKPDAVIHCAGSADVNYSVKHPDSDFETNVMISRRVLYSLKNSLPQTRLIFLSSAAVYGNPQKLPIKENAEVNPISPYALHKVLIEDMCQYFIKQYHLDIRILRVFSCYGEGLKKQIFWDMGQKLAHTGELKMYGTGKETRDFIHVNDLIQAIFLIMQVEKQDENIYNVANGQEISIRNIAEIFCKKCGLKNSIISFTQEDREGNPNNWRADISKLRELGYIPRISMEEGIGLYVKWLKHNSVL